MTTTITKSMSTISPKSLNDIVSKGQSVRLIDVRTPIEFQEVHVPFAENIPLDTLEPTQIGISNEPLYVICRSGARGQKACEKLTNAGLKVINVEGGTMAWDAAGLPVTRGQKVMSLERQVRITAGSIVVLGAALGYFVHPAWIGLSAFIGAGLVFAGITDTCGMGMMLAKMPWNRVRSCGTQLGTCSSK